MNAYVMTSALLLLLPMLPVSPAGGAERDELKAVQVNDTELATREVGEGDPIILVHGTLADYRFWSGHLDTLSKDHRVITYSRRYHHPNAPATSGVEYNEKVHADDLIALIEELDLAPVHLVGSSYGASIAAHAAASRPEHFRTVVLAEPTFYNLISDVSAPEVQEAVKRRAANIARVKELIEEGNEEEAIQTFFDYVLTIPREKRPPQVVASWIENAPTLSVQVDPANPPPAFTCDDAKNITAPTLLVEAENSIEPFGAILDELHSCLPTSERITIAGVGHSPATKAEEFDQAVLEFIEKH